MNKWIKQALLSACIASAMLTISAATALMPAAADATLDTTRFEMVDGAAIRLKTPNGLRFMAEMGADTYENLTKKETGVQKKMGMFIVPYEYLSDATKFSNGAVGVAKKNYENITQKLDYVFYNSDGSVDNKIYEHNGYYRANGVISNLKLKNYDREFVGIGYIAETKNGVTTYTYADFDSVADVRSAAYVALEAYEDYKQNDTAQLIMENYVYGAHLDSLYEGAITERQENGKLIYTYGEKDYESLRALSADTIMDFFTIDIPQTSKFLFVEDKYSIDYAIYNGDYNSEDYSDVIFNGAHAVWTSSNPSVAKVDKGGNVTAVSGGETTITATFMDVTATFTATVVDGTFETLSEAPSYMAKADTTESLSIVEKDGDKALRIMADTDGTTNVNRSPAMTVTTEFLTAIFADKNVDYIAFDAIADRRNNNFRRDTGSELEAVTYEHDMVHDVSGFGYEAPTTGVREDSWKTFYFSRADYNYWVSKGVTSARFIASGGFGQNESIYIDNIRPVTAEEAKYGKYSLESGGVRVNDNAKTLLFYMYDQGSTWQFNIQSSKFTSVGYTNENVTDGIRALQVTKEAGTLSFNFTGDRKMYNDIVTNTGYYAVDVYIPEDSDATCDYHYDDKYPGATLKKGGWTTFYVSDSKNQIVLTDTTGGTYLVDNIRSISEQEYLEGSWSFEANTGVLRNDGTAAYVYTGRDMAANRYSIAVTGATLSNSHFDSAIVKEGSYSLAFTKGEGTVALQMRADNNVFPYWRNGISFWIYSTVAINGTGTSNFNNGPDTKPNSGAGYDIPANTWTQVALSKEDIVQATGEGQAVFLRIGGGAGTIYIDGIKPIDTYKITYKYNGESTFGQTVVCGEEYQLLKPTSTLKFLGWVDENGKFFDESGIWNLAQDVTLTAVYDDVIDFEDGKIPSNWSADGSVDVVEINGNKVMRVTTPTNRASDNGIIVPRALLAEFFVDSNVKYIAFDVMSGTTKKGKKVYYQNNGWTVYENSDYDTPYAECFKTYYFPRSAYDAWVTNKITSSRIVMFGGNLVGNGEVFYADNFRGVTEEEYATMTNPYSFERGGLRTDNGSMPLFYITSVGYPWQVGWSNVNPETIHFTRDIVSDGNSAIEFTKYAGETWFKVCHFADGEMEVAMRNAGYFAVDLYVPEGSDAKMVGGSHAGYSLATGWNTIYVQMPTDTSVNDIFAFSDTTGSTYVMDNIRFLTEEEYYAGAWSFAAGKGSLRTAELGDEKNHSGVFYYYAAGADTSKNLFSFAFAEGNGAGDVNAVSNPRFDAQIKYDDTASIAFDKGNGYMYVAMRGDTETTQYLQGGFEYWIYSTVAIDGVNSNQIINGKNAKYNGGAGVYVPANRWTRIVVTPEDGIGGRFLILQGSYAGTIYLDGFKPIDVESYTVTYDAGEDGVMESDTQKVVYGVNYQLKTPKTDLEFVGWADENGDLFNMNGVWTLKQDVTLTAVYEMPAVYKVTVGSEENGTAKYLNFAASTTTLANQGALPADVNDTEDMSYYSFEGSYGLNDFLVFDITGNNMPILTFFNSVVTNTIYNQEENSDVKGWIVANGMTTMNGSPFGGFGGVHANRITMIGEYKINYKFDDNGSQTKLTQTRASIDDKTNISMNALQSVTDTYRIIVGWVENGAYMNLRMFAMNLATGQIVADYNINKYLPKANWEGDIALYGHFGRETYVDAVYPIEEDMTIEDVVTKYMPEKLMYKSVLKGDKLEMEAGTATGAANTPTADLPYYRFGGTYGLNDYVVFDITGDNMPFVSFFSNKVTNNVFNPNRDLSVRGWVFANGFYQTDGTIYGGETDSNAHWRRLSLIGTHMMGTYDAGNNDFRRNWYGDGDNNPDHPLSIKALRNVTDTYRIIIGIGARDATNVNIELAAINMVTGERVCTHKWQVASMDFEEGSIALHGQIGRSTTIDRIFPIEEDTTLDEVIAKCQKDTDYSDEAPIELDRYAYSSLSDGTWLKDGVTQDEGNPDFRFESSAYETYKNAGFNIVLAQTAISTDSHVKNADGTTTVWNESDAKTFMDLAHAQGLKVILTDWHLQVWSEPITISGTSYSADSKYGPWVIGTDLNADGTGKTAAVQAYLDAVSATGLTVTARYADRAALDKAVLAELAVYKDHPAFYGVMLGDEPSYHNAYCYGEIYNSIKRVMPECYVQYNLLPMEHNLGTIKLRYPGLSGKSSASNQEIENAYIQYVNGFLDSMKTDYIQYDDYPFKSAVEGILFWEKTVPYVDPTALRNIQIMAEIAKERGLNVKVVTQSCVMRSGGEDGAIHIRQINEADARWLNNYLMGFGVKQINYFTYWTKGDCDSDGEWFDDNGSFVNHDGTTTEIYTFMQKIMGENDKLAPTLFKFNYNGSRVFGSNTDSKLNNEHITWSSSFSADSFKWLTNVTSGKEYTLVTELYDKTNYNYMYMVMNTIDPSEGGTQNVTVTLNSKVKSFYVYTPDGTRTSVDGNTYTVSLTAGQAIYILPYAFN